MGLVPKNVKGECNSVNKHIPRDKVVVLYESVENLIHLIEKFGKGALMAKLDIEDSYRKIPTDHLDDYHFLSFVWNNQY